MKKLLPLLLSLLLLTACAVTYDGPTQAKPLLTSRETIYYDDSGEISQHQLTEYAYDVRGNQSQALDYTITDDPREREPFLKTVLSYDEAGNVTRQRQYDLSGWFPNKIVDIRYTYDDLGRRISERHRYDLSWDDATIVYDDDARTRTTSNNGNTIVEYLSENGWVIRSESDFGDGVRITEEFTRRPDGQILTIQSHRDGVLYSVSSYTYDDLGRPLTWTTTEDGETTVLFRWEYGEDYEKLTFTDGSYTITDYNPDGTRDDSIRCDPDGTIRELTIFRYTELQVPAKERLP